MDVLGSESILEGLVVALTVNFRLVKEDGGILREEARTRCILHAFMGQLTSGTNHVPVLTNLIFLDVFRYRVVHLLHLLFSVPVNF